jgi:Mg-chelatase subunit ChlD
MTRINHIGFVTCLTIAAAVLATAVAVNAKTAPEEAEAKESPTVDVVFVLDTTGSMGGLIEGAKLKIWSIANQIIGGSPTPDLRVGLVGYRDKGDEYVTQVIDLSSDLDEVYAQLMSFRAGGFCSWWETRPRTSTTTTDTTSTWFAKRPSAKTSLSTRFSAAP